VDVHHFGDPWRHSGNDRAGCMVNRREAVRQKTFRKLKNGRVVLVSPLKI
jgi:hypothetical protein